MRFGGVIVLLLVGGAGWEIWAYQGEVTDFLQKGANQLFLMFREEETFPLLLAGVLLAVAFTLLLSYGIIVVFPKSFHLWRLCRYIRSHRDEVEMAKHFGEISVRVGKSKLIGHAWREFEETLVKPGSDGKVVQNTTRPHFFINYGCAQESSLALRYMPHIPNYFVGIGLLLTFVGLVAALSFASDTVGGDVNKALAGLKDLLAAATFKFWTSIAGLLASILLSFCFRFYALHLEGQFVTICRAIESGMAFATPQRILVDMRDTLEGQLAETKKINTEVAMAIAESVGQQFRQHVPRMLSDAMKPLVESVGEMARNVGKGATDGVDQMVKDFAQTIEGSAGQHMRDMSETLAQLQGALSTLQGSMGASGDEFSRRMAEGSERLDATMSEVARVMRELTDGLKSQIGVVGQEYGNSMQVSLEKLGKQSEAMALEIGRQSRDASASFAAEIGNAAQALSTSARDSAKTSADFAEELRNTLGAGVDGVQGGLERLAGAMNALDGQLNAQGLALREVADRGRDTARTMDDAANSLKAGIAPFEAVGRSLVESTHNLEQSVSEIGARIESAASTVETVSADLGKVSQVLQSAWSSYQERFEGVDKDLERTFEAIGKAVEQQQSQVQDFVRKLDASFDKALSGLAGGIEGISSNVEELVEGLEKMNGQTHRD